MKENVSGCFFSEHSVDYVDSTGHSSARGRQTRVGKISCFRAKFVSISKTVGDTSKGTIND